MTHQPSQHQDLRTALDPSTDWCAPREVMPSSEDVHAWISRAYRDPEDRTMMDAVRFTRWNMEVAFQAGFGAGYRTAPPRPDHAGGVKRVRHLKRGTEYEVLGEAEAQVANGSYSVWPKGMDIMSEAEAVPARLVSDGHTLTVYRDPKTGKIWCRFTDEFRDGRFETITPAQAQDKAAEREGVEDLEVEALCDSVLGNCYLGKEPEADLAEKIKKSLAPKPTGTEAGRGDAPRPAGNNADEWHAWLDEHRGYGSPYIAVQIAEAMDAATSILRKALARDARVEVILEAVLTPADDPEHGDRDHLPRVLRDFLNEECGRAGLTGANDGYAEGYAKAQAEAATPTPPTPDSTAQGDGTSQEGGR